MQSSSEPSSPLSHFSALSTSSHSSFELDPSSSKKVQSVLAIAPPCQSTSKFLAFIESLIQGNEESYILLTIGHTSRRGKHTLHEAIELSRTTINNTKALKLWSQISNNTSQLSVVDEKDLKFEVKSTDLKQTDALNIFSKTGLHVIFSTSFCEGSLYTLEYVPFSFPSLVKAPENPYGPPTREEWKTLWKAWDLVTLGMIPTEMLHQKPIDLRHKCLFYIGHIPTFVNMLLSHLYKEPYTDPKNYTMIFERGIDPHVDDPNHCHSHSEVPERDEDWPTLEDILEYRDRIRARLMQVYDDLDTGKRVWNRSIGRVLHMTFEHEGFHIETLLYMLIQRAGTGTLPPPGFTTPPWKTLVQQWNSIPNSSSKTVTLGPDTLVMGHDDSEADDADPALVSDVKDHIFGWDNESPRREVQVSQFRIDWRPITNGEFLVFWDKNGRNGGVPPSWVETDGEIFVRTVHGPVPMSVAEKWPVLASFDQLSDYASSKGGRLPTEPELRLFFDKYESGFENGANVGFRNWHPVPATSGCGDEKGSNGGIWEWTSTVFDAHPGLSPTKHFPGYSTDFFDGKHQVVLGASYATIPRLCRRTVRNFYQHNYPYAWVGARVAYDI